MCSNENTKISQNEIACIIGVSKSTISRALISQNEIACIIGVSKSTISRALKPNTGKRSYRPKQAHHLSCDIKANNSQKVTDFGWQYIDTLLTRKYSPEQIAGRLKLLGWQGVSSHERIYQNGGALYQAFTRANC